MKKIGVILLAILFVVAGSYAQAQEVAEQTIPVRVLVPVNKAVKGDALSILHNRLGNAVTLNNMEPSANASRFVIVTQVNILSKNGMATIPPQFTAEIEVSFFFVDNINKVILSQEIITKKGLDDTDDGAVAKAVKSIQARDPKLKKLMTAGKKKALEYYDGKEKTSADVDVSWIFE